MQQIFYIFIFVFINISNIFAGNESIIEIDQPRFSEKGLNKRSYEIKAEKGIKSDTQMELFRIEGKYKTEEGKWIYLKADEGRYDEDEKIIHLYNNINFYTEFEDNLFSEKAIFYMDKELIEFYVNVVHENKEGVIFSDKVFINESLDNIKYHGNVMVKLNYNE
tara:strand:- start:123 stop:614 length:492 start_codon:yes stop_codon:yes gene_type:complete